MFDIIKMSVHIAPEEERFMTNTLVLCSAIKDCLDILATKNVGSVPSFLVDYAINYIKNYDKTSLLEGFIDASNEYWDIIKKRDENFFINNASKVFGNLPLDQVNIFKDVFTAVDENGKSYISADQKNDIWSLFDQLVKVSIKYIHRKRSPYSKVIEGNITNLYKESFKSNINLEYHSVNWNLKLLYNAEI